MSRRLSFISLALSCLILSLIGATPTPPEGGQVRAVLFYSPTCPHCEYVMEETLPPLHEKYGQRLQVLKMDVTQPAGQGLFLAAIKKFDLDGGVPTLIIGDVILISSVDIPEKFPALIEQYLAQGGLDWPDIPGLTEMLAAQAGEAQEPEPAATAEPPASLGEKLKRDPLGNALAIIALIGMLAVAIGGVFAYRRPPAIPSRQPRNWWVAVLCLAGMGVAAYMAYVETAQVRAVCGPVGDCNAVQQSSYARLFGVLPIGVLGLGGYLAILLAWLVGQQSNERLADYASMAMLGMTAFGLLFSIYLTFLEPFIIGAACAWCLTSAVIITALFWLSLTPAKPAWSKLFASAQNNPTKKRPARRPVSKSKAVVRRKRLVKQHQKSKGLWIGLGVVAVGIISFLFWPKNPSVAEISANQAYQKYQQGAFFLDVRGLEEWRQGHIADSVLIPLDELQQRLDELPTDQDIVVVCLSGVRSKEGAVILLKAGFKRATCLKGG